MPPFSDGPVFAPFWKNELTPTYARCPYPIVEDFDPDESVEFIYEGAEDIAFASWCSLQRAPIEVLETPPVQWRPRLEFPADSTVSIETLEPPRQRNRAKKLKGSGNKSERTVMRTRKLRMRLTKDQKKILCNWMGAARFTYNKSLEAVKKEKLPLDQSILQDRFLTAKEQTLPSEMTEKETALRARRVERLSEHNIVVGKFIEDHPWLKDTPQCVRLNAIRSLIKAHDANTAKREAMEERGEKKKHKFKLKYRSKKRPSSWTIEIEGRGILSVKTIQRPVTRRKNDAKHANRREWTELSMFEKRLGGKILLTGKIPGEAIAAAVKITRNRLGHFHMHVPIATNWVDLPKLKPEKERSVVALDPGVRTFQTFYSPNLDFGGFASGQRGFNKVYDEALKCDKKVSELVKVKDLTFYERSQLLKSKYRSIERVRNLVDDVHKKVAKDLCDNYDTIVLPIFETQKMVSRKTKRGDLKKRKINNKTARSMLTWKHYAFRTYLASKVVMCGKELAIVTEEYTTQCCGQCGKLNKEIGGAKVFKCAECSFVCGRDENAARNIFMKYLEE